MNNKLQQDFIALEKRLFTINTLLVDSDLSYRQQLDLSKEVCDIKTSFTVLRNKIFNKVMK